MRQHRLSSFSVDEKQVGKTRKSYISLIRGALLVGPISLKFGLTVEITDVRTCARFCEKNVQGV